MNKFLQNLIFSFRKPPIVVIFGPGCEHLIKIISHIAGPENKILMICADSNYRKNNLEFLIKKSSLPILVFLENNNSSGLENILSLVKNFSHRGFIVSDKNFSNFRKIKNEAQCRVFTFGLSNEANIFATDINFTEEGTNFKINYGGNIVPFWIKKKTEEKEINALLAVILISVLNGINLVEISQALRNFNF